MLVSIHPENPQARVIQQMVSLLEDDGVIIYPTDTVYGLGCSVHSKKAMERIRQIKDMDPKQPMTFVCSSESQIQQYIQGLPTPVFKLIRRHLPGPYTFIFQASKVVPKVMLTKRSTVGVRWPDHPIAIALVEALGHPILSSSLRVDETELYDDADLLHDVFGHQVDAVIDGGKIFAENSTMIDFTQPIPEVLRYGKGDIVWLEEALK